MMVVMVFLSKMAEFLEILNALDEIARKKIGNFNFSNNQNILITDISDKNALIKILEKYKLNQNSL